MTKTVVCIDTSGSTYGNSHYYQTVQEIIADIPDDATYVSWNSTAKVEPKSFFATRFGSKYTSPKSFVPYIGKADRLVVITDGQIPDSDVADCTAHVQKIQLVVPQVEFHFIGPDWNVDMSVSVPFLKNNIYILKRYVEDEPAKVADHGNLQSPLNFEQYYNDPKFFLQHFESLYAKIVVRQMINSPENQKLGDEARALRQNLLTYLRTANSNIDYDQLRSNMRNDLDSAYQKIREIVVSGDKELDREIDSATNRLIAACNKVTGYSFSLLQPRALERAEPLEQVDAVNVADSADVDDFEGFVCPITYESDHPCILIKEGPGILMDLNKKELDMLIENPLYLVSLPEVMNRLKARLGSVLGIQTSNTLLESSRKDPYHGVKFTSVFTLDQLNTKMNRFAIADLLFDRKLVGRYVGWVVALYLALNQLPMFNDEDEHRHSFKEAFIQYLKTYLPTCKVPITLSSYMIEPMLNVPYDVAAWYCVSSPMCTKYQGKSNRMRDMGAIGRQLYPIVELFGYQFDKVKIDRLIDLYEGFRYLQSQARLNEKHINDLITAQWQNSTVLKNGKIVLLDGPTTTPVPLPDPLKRLSVRDLFKLRSMIDKQVADSTIPIPNDFNSDEVEIPVPLHLWYTSISNERLKYLHHNLKITISPKTMRPVYYNRDHGFTESWRESSERIYGPLDQQLSLYRYFILAVEHFDAYPDEEQFISYLYDRITQAENPKETLPALIRSSVAACFRNYQQVLGTDFSKVPSEEFIMLTRKSMPKDYRPVLDGSIALL